MQKIPSRSSDKNKVYQQSVVDQYRKFKLLIEYLYQKGLADVHTPSAVLRNHIEDLLRYYSNKVDDSTDSSKDLSNTSVPDTALLLPSLEEEGQEKDIGLIIKSNTCLPSEALLSTYNDTTGNNNANTNSGDISLEFIPNKISILPSGIGTSSLHLKALDKAKPLSWFSIW